MGGRNLLAELWAEYRELAKTLLGVVLELVAIFLVIKLGSLLLHWLDISTASCSRSDLLDCAHTIVLIGAWFALLGSFVVVAAYFTWRHTMRRIREVGTASEVEEVRIDVKEVRVELEDSQIIMRALTALQPTAAASDRTDSIRELEQLRTRSAFDRTVNIFLGRLYKAQGNLDGAAAALTSFLEAKQTAGQKTDKDFADVLYNRACYLALRSAELIRAGSPTDADNMKLRAYDDLEASIRLSPENKDDARHDVDFAGLWGEARFQQLVGQGS